MSKSKIHPVAIIRQDPDCKAPSPASKLTVWQKSSMSFQGTDGFTVFDRRGRLVFRVDNYSRSNSSDLVLMDGDGNPLIKLEQKKLSMQKQWTAFQIAGGGGENSSAKLFSIFKSSVLGSRKTEAEVVMMRGGGGEAEWLLRVEGAFRRRRCEIVRVSDGQVVAKISRKRANSKVLLGDEVFSLEIMNSLEADVVMAFVVALDRIFPRSSPAPIMCS